MKYAVCVLAIFTILLASSCRLCEKVLIGTITDKKTELPLANVEVNVTGVEDDGFGSTYHRLDAVFTDDNGVFTVATNKDIEEWEYTVGLDGYIGANEIIKGYIYGVNCGEQKTEITMQAIAFVDFKVIDDLTIAGNSVSYFTDFPAGAFTDNVLIGETMKFPVIAGELIEIELQVYDTSDELLKEETISVQLTNGEIKLLEYGI